jgi:hypothetical protein
MPITSFFILGERISLRRGLGIAVVVICVFPIQMRRETTSELRRLRASVKQKDNLWAFATLGPVVAYRLVDKAWMMLFGHGKRFFQK